MNNKVTLTFENGEFSVFINENLIDKNRDLDESFEKFKQVIRDNVAIKTNSWESIEEKVKRFRNEEIEINTEHKNLNFRLMKYFYSTDKIFYMKNGTMTPLMGGYSLFDFILTLISNNLIDNYEDLLGFCKVVLENKIMYRTTETSISVSSPKFNYGSAEYNFTSKKISKGASIINGTFDEFKDYVFDIIKK